MDDASVPVARVRGSLAARLRAFVLVGPRRVTASIATWFASVAVFTALVHAGFFLACTLVETVRRDFGESDRIKILLLGLLASLFFAGLQWLLTLIGAMVGSLMGWALGRLPLGPGAILGAVYGVWMMLAIEVVAAAPWVIMADAIPMPRLVILVATGAIGALWGAWLPEAWRGSRERRGATPP